MKRIRVKMSEKDRERKLEKDPKMQLRQYKHNMPHNCST